MKITLAILAVCLSCEGAMTNLCQHPSTVAGVSVNGSYIATACYDGNLRVIDASGAVIMSEHRGSQISACAWSGVNNIYTDTDVYIGKEGIAADPSDGRIDGFKFTLETPILSISKSSHWGVGQNLMAYNRVTGTKFLATPSINSLDWPMAIEEWNSGTLIVCGLDGCVRVFDTLGNQLSSRFITYQGLIAMDIDGSRIVITDFSANVYVLDASLNLIAKAALPSLGYAVRFYQSGAVVGCHDGKLLFWDLQPDPAVTVKPSPRKTKNGVTKT
jgi:WD40 repeat protein